MSKLKVAFQGEPGANSDIAAREVYPDCETVPCATFEDALSAISNGEADLGMIPIENSIAGRVADIHHLLPHANLHIIGEHFLRIHFNLMAPKGATLSTIKIGREPYPRARPVPPLHPPAWLQGGDRRRHGGRGAAHFADERPHARRARAEARRQDLRARRAGRERRGRGPQHHALRHPVAREQAGRAGQRAGRHDLRVPGAQPAGRALQGARRFRHQRREHDQARKLHDRGQFLRHHVLRRRRRAIRRTPPLARALEELEFFTQPGSLRILGVYPANPFRSTFKEEKD